MSPGDFTVFTQTALEARIAAAVFEVEYAWQPGHEACIAPIVIADMSQRVPVAAGVR